MPKVNYKHEKRQKDIQKKKKRDEKIQRRQTKKEIQPNPEMPAPPAQKGDASPQEER